MTDVAIVIADAAYRLWRHHRRQKLIHWQKAAIIPGETYGEEGEGFVR